MQIKSARLKHIAMHCGSSNTNDSSNIHLQKRQRTDDKIRSAMLDFEVFDCPICFEPLIAPIFQCDNGHLACSLCCPKLRNKCPFCTLPIGNKRCRAMEKVLESIFIPCSMLGCTKNVCYGELSAHEKDCKFSLCACPVPGCKYIASYKDIYDHFTFGHRESYYRERPMLRDRDMFTSGNSFILELNINDKCFRELCGVYVSVCCIAPSSSEAKEFSYDLSYTIGGQTMIYKSLKVKRIRKVSLQIPHDNFMLIPQSLLHGEFLNIEASIKTINKVQ
ncbi:unnamed protein product [Eruca vesicaria subsp. sativa]|uniref:RING-type E3 ubiquitin transferase n=1 Tax=Eruca vesicaria subsp. sativa TaxID=29727 RepID=A0ABC8LXL9_ERUVS|nr:unnamed protein product [Eruca vesicaria subsp. sativa]